MVISRNVGWPNLNLGGALTKSGGTSVQIVRLSKREIEGSLAYLPFLLSRIGLTISVPVFSISDAVHCNRPRSALQPSLQCTASVLAVHCLLVILLLLMVNVGLHGHTIITIEGWLLQMESTPMFYSTLKKSIADNNTSLRIFPLGRSSSLWRKSGCGKRPMAAEDQCLSRKSRWVMQLGSSSG